MIHGESFAKGLVVGVLLSSLLWMLTLLYAEYGSY